MPMTEPGVRHEKLWLACAMQNSTRKGLSDTDVTDVAVKPWTRPQRQNVTTQTPEASSLKTSLNARLRSSPGAISASSLAGGTAFRAPGAPLPTSTSAANTDATESGSILSMWFTVEVI